MNKQAVQSKPKGKPTGKPGRRTASREVRRGQLIDATIESIARHGIGGTTMQRVTEIAGLSIGIVNFHFESKQNLFEETLVFLAREHHDRWRAAYEDAGLSAKDKLLAIVDAHFDPKICDPKKIAVWFAFYGEAGRREVYRSLMNQMDRERFDLTARLCEALAGNGPPPAQPPEEVARTLESLYDGACLNMLMYPDFLSRETAREQVRAYLATVFPHHFQPSET